MFFGGGMLRLIQVGPRVGRRENKEKSNDFTVIQSYAGCLCHNRLHTTYGLERAVGGRLYSNEGLHFFRRFCDDLSLSVVLRFRYTFGA